MVFIKNWYEEDKLRIVILDWYVLVLSWYVLPLIWHVLVFYSMVSISINRNCSVSYAFVFNLCWLLFLLLAIVSTWLPVILLPSYRFKINHFLDTAWNQIFQIIGSLYSDVENPFFTTIKYSDKFGFLRKCWFYPNV